MLTLELVEIALAASALSITIARAKATAGFRDWVQDRSELFGHLVHCPYCISHWAAICMVALLPFKGLGWLFVDIFAIVAIAAVVTGTAMKLLHMDERVIEELQQELNEVQTENVQLRLALSQIADGE